jgi:serine/threonine-protein kinase
MGEVYRARDTKLGREVALKVLPADFASDPERLARFQREAQILASLNHPNIAIIHGLEDSEGTPALVLELVEGPTLRDRIAAGRVPVEEAVSVARQVATALEAAHEHGIVHRDLKPANIKITPAGVVKVLDFGLAKLTEAPGLRAQGSGPNLTAAPTITSPAMRTGLGIILGTAAYMAPEQARGHRVDKRADIWAFGCVLYEMLTGKRPFEGSDVSDTLASVLKIEPVWTALPSNTAPALRRLLRRTLEKDRDQRLHDIADARLELDEALREPEPPAVPAAAPARRQAATLVAAVGLTAALAAGTAWWLSGPGPAPVRRLSIAIEPERPLGVTNDPGVALSPDGSKIVYVTGLQAAEASFVLRTFDRLDAVPIAGTGQAHSPIFSPDGEWIAFFADADRTLKKVPLNGGPAVTIAKAPSSHLGASWGSDGTVVFAGPGLSRVSAAGGTPTAITTLDVKRNETRHAFPDILPNNRGVLFTATVGNVPRIEVLRFDTGERRVVAENAEVGRYAATGHVVYSQGGRLFAVPFDQNQFRATGPAVPVLDGVAETTDGPAVFGIARDGMLVYLPGTVGERAGVALVWVDRKGQEEPLAAKPRHYIAVRVSPDGRRLAMEVEEASNGDVWVHDLVRNTQTRLTFAPEAEGQPLWSADARRVLFASPTGLFVKSADGTGDPERVASDLSSPVPHAWSRDGKSLVFSMGGDLYLLALAGDAKPQPLVQTQFTESHAELSPDGRWIAYSSNESGSFEVYVQPFPDISRGRWQISTDGGFSPAWSADGRELFYIRVGPFLGIMAVPIDGREGFTAGLPKQLFAGPYNFDAQGRSWDVAPDGRFLMLKPETVQQGSNRTLVVVENWLEELKRLVPVN